MTEGYLLLQLFWTRGGDAVGHAMVALFRTHQLAGAVLSAVRYRGAADPACTGAASPASHQEAHHRQQERNAADVSTRAGRGAVRDYDRELLQHEHLRDCE